MEKFQNDDKLRENNPTYNNQYAKNKLTVESYIRNIHEYTKRKESCEVYYTYVERECMMSIATINFQHNITALFRDLTYKTFFQIIKICL